MIQERKYELHPAVGHLIQQPSPEQIVTQRKEALTKLGFPTDDPQKLFDSLLERSKEMPEMAGPLHDLVLYDPKIREIGADRIVFKNFDPDKGTGILIVFSEDIYKTPLLPHK